MWRIRLKVTSGHKGFSYDDIANRFTGGFVIGAAICSVSLELRDRVEVNSTVKTEQDVWAINFCSEAGVLR